MDMVDCGNTLYVIEVKWKLIIFRGFKVNYEVNNVGEVRNKSTKRLLSSYIDKDGYRRVTLSMYNTKSYHAFVHRLVATAFIDNPDNKPQVNHKDGDKQNNCELNLEWVTGSENVKHAFDNGLKVSIFGEENTLSKYKTKDIRKICEMLEKKISPKKISEKMGFPRKYISDIKYGKRWRHISREYKLPIYVHCDGYIEHIVELLLAGYSEDEIINKEYLDPISNKSTKLLFKKAHEFINTSTTISNE